MSLTTLEITSTTHAAFLPEIWSKDTQNAIEFKEVLAKLVETKFEAEMSVGRILHIPHRSNMATQTKTEGISNTIVFNTITQTNQDITVSTYEYAACLLNKIVQVQSKYADRAALAGSMGYALVRGQEVSLAALPASFSQVVGAYGAETDESVARRAWQYIADAGFVEESGGCSWVFSPGAAQSLFGQERFVNKDFVSGKSAIETAKLPTMFNFPAYVSNLLKSPASGQHDNTLFHRSAVILVRQQRPKAESQYRIEYNADAMLMWDLYAVAEAEQPTETPTTASGGTGSSELEALGDSAAVLIKGM